MRRPWQYWSCYAAACVVVLTAMGWLTLKAIELDRAESLARRQADLEEAIGRALWRMDVKLMPHLAREAARPYAVYASLLPSSDAQGKAQPELSPLLTDRSEFVLVNYQVEPGDVWSSPQAPPESTYRLLCDNGASPEEMAACTAALGSLQTLVSYNKLVSSLPFESSLSRDEFGNQSLLQNSIINIEQFKQSGGLAQEQQQRQPIEREPGRQTGKPSDSNDYLNRDAAVKSYAQEAVAQQMPAFRALNDSESVTEGVSQPIWIGNQLLLARRVDVGEKVVIQGCWLDWSKIRSSLIEEVRDVLPGVSLQPVLDSSQAQVGRMLATLPVQLVARLPEPQGSVWSAMQVSLAMAWACVLLAAVAAAVLLHGVLTLSERRGAFVSAVTHELRTPLTTFRMYSEMLANDMVPDPAKRQTYLDTLRVEADRLSHLVENVLSYAKLERGPQRHNREQLSIDALLERVGERLADRARQAEMQLVIDATDVRETTFKTDPAAAEQILFNLVDNACKYAARANDRRIHLDVSANAASIQFRVRDHGYGISPREAKSLFRPFSKSADEAAHSAPGVGLGLALCRRLAHDLGGQLEWLPTDEAGAVFQLTLPR
ncbi:MAG: HAMP domain-containing sensor histidine kinase [Planctomycetota bacterium]|nr:HAMP domain-containing sensor histidine kinase [Planctomycetota bacterium]